MPNQIDAAAIGRRISQARRQAGLTQPKLASTVGVTLRTMQGYEGGEVVPYRRMDTIAAAVSQSAEWLLYGEAGQAARLTALEARLDQLEARLGEGLAEVAGLAELVATNAQQQATHLAQLVDALTHANPFGERVAGLLGELEAALSDTAPPTLARAAGGTRRSRPAGGRRP